MRSDAQPVPGTVLPGLEAPGRAPAPPKTAAQRVARAVLGVLDATIGGLAVAGLVALVAIVFANVVGRYLLGASLVWSLDAARWLFVAVIMLGVPLAHRMRMHLLVSVLVDRLPRPARIAAGVASDVVTAYTTIALLAGGFTLLAVIGGTNATLRLPEWVRFAPVPVSCTLGLVYLALRGLDEGERVWQGPLAIALAGLAWFLLGDGFRAAVAGIDPAIAMGVAFAVALAIGTPVAFAILFSAFVANMAGDVLPPAAVVQNLVNGATKVVLLAIPFFILAGALMNAGGLTRRLVDFAFSLVGHFRGGLAQVNVVSSGLYAGISGSSYSDAALGTKLFVPQMVARGYAAPFACAVTAASATLPNVIPPSIALLLVAAAGNLSVGSLWVAGIVPGLLMAVLLMVAIRWIAIRRGYGAGAERASGRARARALLAAIPVVALAVLVIVGIRFGAVTPTEAGVLAVVYAFLVGTILYRAWSVRSLYAAVRAAAVEAALVGLLVGAASPFAFVLVTEQLPQALAAAIGGLAEEPFLALLLANVLLLVFGTILDIGAAILILTPLLVPALTALGVDPTHLGVVIVVNLMLGGLTPPIGMLAFIASTISGTPVHAIFRQIVPLLAVLIAALLAVTYVPAISLGLGRLLDAL